MELRSPLPKFQTRSAFARSHRATRQENPAFTRDDAATRQEFPAFARAAARRRLRRMIESIVRLTGTR
jgi:hypothetical protein